MLDMLLDTVFSELFDDYMKKDALYKKLSEKAAFSSCICHEMLSEEYYKYIIDIENSNCFFTSHCTSESLKYGFMAYVQYYKNGVFPDMLKDGYEKSDNSYMDNECKALEADYKKIIESGILNIPYLNHSYLYHLVNDFNVLRQHCTYLACKYGFYSCYQIFRDLHVL